MSSFHQQQQQFYGQGPPQQQMPPAYGAPYGGNPNQPVFPGFQNVSPEMINFGLNAGQDILNKQKDKWMPGVSGFWLSLKYYFSVSWIFCPRLSYSNNFLGFKFLGQQQLCFE